MTDEPSAAPTYAGLPERIDLPDGSSLRRYTEDDLPRLVDTVNANLEHLRPWMPWAGEPATMQTQGEWLHGAQQRWDDGHEFAYGIFDTAGRVVGGTGLHSRNGPGVLEIGYWLSADAVGRGLATAAAQAMTDVAAALDDVRRVEIRCDEGNVRSAAVAQRLGYSLIRVEDRPPTAPAESSRHQVWSIDVTR
ncbi:MAG: hypothetical protein QOF18_2754 [Frankiaceae bacterium]|nr:hypothetical protein [Frankiaceae bacterium]